MQNSSNGVWRYSSSIEELPALLNELQEKSIIFPFELDYLLGQISNTIATQNTDAQKTVLSEIRCHLVRGYLFSKPLPVNKFCTKLLLN